ncbi:SRPBCC family protein [Pontibacter sp. JH31]|uniref:SRPBCC family protein n=1 Tax=Pontibacter aquaedesilientis TaxID=2766980 RepID=A0ABR7XJK6_9BACT|nr:SRPBCC family protein [Pontibacter aquaedesilientis]MBD1398494.1 SRPBCC family protein [Pontibacter aquaedesilientis]
MKILKKILLTVVALVVLALVVALFVNKEYAVEREITINRPKAEVYDYLKFLKNQDEFSVWATKDPNMKKDFRGTDGTVGFVSSWDSESDDVGAGEQEIKGMTEGERIDYELRFFRPFEATDNAYLVTEAVSENQTKVKWGFDGKMDYPMNLMLLFMDMEEMLGNDLQAGLDQLKVNLEK